MKNKPLTLQIWFVISAILLVISLLLAILFPTTLRSFFTKEMYRAIENEQLILKEYGLPNSSEEYYFGGNDNVPLRNRSVHHVFLPENLNIPLISQTLPINVLREIQLAAATQENLTERYSTDVGEKTLFYVIQKVTVNGQPAFLLSYSWDSYRNDLVQTLFKQLLFIMSIVFLLSWIPSIWLAKYLSRPLVALEKHVRRISKQDWHEPVNVDREDEIGKLGASIEQMRERLVKKDEAQQVLLQNISHDLKTPVMVIRSYSQSIQDGIYPKGDLQSTVQVIEDEAERLEKKIKDLLYLTKLDYLATKKVEGESFDFSLLINQVIDRFRWTRSDLEWNVNASALFIKGDREQWMKVLENIIENQLRYAKTTITISFKQEDKHAKLTIGNDGPPIEYHVLETLFEPFHKGMEGEFGIGLSIVKRVVSYHGATIWAENKESGVRFHIRIPAFTEEK
ncbi:sensor histidine kinase [Metabacillus iocasae]|uniref:histidine kinase n=1 Tax=Priestia iocasae TaxID=2291674 RepID=A0ABS2QRU3_9BACI|nr:HAMP domain-containing sensor histidine kinase [Metabacillus iocasae]MBM7702174.1 two-component system sensor histidine kinase CssS [Metabacillus iocasae]